ncbi:MAG: hypothetical protein CL946_07640 [Ectothiorhodospiraceae bacterium]|nr:hypothetical protein [Ectothiorhodospiraceae bacterium]
MVHSVRHTAAALFAVLFAFGAVGMPIGMPAQDVSFTASVSQNEVAEGQQFQVTFTLSGGSLRQHRNFSAPDLNQHFLTLMGPSTSTQMQFINGRTSSSISWTYVVQPRKKGTFTIPPATIEYDGEQIKTNSVQVKVVAGSGSQSQRGGGSQSGEDALNIDDDFYMRAVADKRTAYLGEPITVTYKVFSRVNFQFGEIVKLPRSIGFWAEEFEIDQPNRYPIEVIDGKQYQVLSIKRVQYFPTQSGELFIEPFEVSSVVRVRQKRRSSNNQIDRFFSDPFFDRYQNVEYTLRSQRLKIDVKPLPEAGMPESFKGAVGTYTMDVSLDREDIKANETASLKVKIQGSGNIKLLEGPDVDFPTSVDTYDPRIEDDMRSGAGRISGTRTFEYIFIPRFPGQLTIPPVEFSYFDYKKEEYVELTGDEFELDIAKGAPRDEANEPTQADVDYLAMDVNPLKQADGELRRRGETAVPISTMMLMYLIPAFVAAGGIAWKRRYDRIHGDAVGLRMRRATKTAEKHLAASKKYLDHKMIEKYYQEVARALWGYIQHKLTIPTSETSVEGVLAVLRNRNISDATIANTKEALDGIEYARFSPTRAEHAEMAELYDKARTAIVTIEQELRA